MKVAIQQKEPVFHKRIYSSVINLRLSVLHNYFSQNEKALIKWRAKERFPSDHQIKERLRQINTAYSEIKEAIPEVFEHYEELLKKAINTFTNKDLIRFILVYYNIKVKREREHNYLLSFLNSLLVW